MEEHRPFFFFWGGGRGYKEVLGGSWVVISGVISRVTIVITHIKGTYNPTSNYPCTSKYGSGLYYYSTLI